MSANLENKLVVSNPDFSTIRENLKNFLRSQTTFSDYDFEGSGLTQIIDLLAYNTHYMAFYANMIANESFLDTASIRDSVVSHSKMLGYTPHSTTSAVARINLSFTLANNSLVANTTAMTIPRFTKFSSSAIDGVNYIFTNLEEKTVQRANDELKFINLDITEGTPVSYVYEYNSLTNPVAVFEIPDANVDTDTLEVIVQNSALDTTQQTFELAEDATTVTEDSPVYFLEESKGQKYKISFGNGVLGKALTDGNIVILSYLISSGAAANKATGFTLLDSIGGMTSPTITIIQTAFGGTAAEDIDSIKFAAPKSYISNNRAVTKNDYIAQIQKNYPSFQTVNVWGGEENDPPHYGQVYISAKPYNGYSISTTEKQYVIDNIVGPLSMMTVVPVMVDPDYTYLNLDIMATYDPTTTTKTIGQIGTLIRSAVNNFANTSLNVFNSYFKQSRLSREIDNIDTSIQSNQIDIKLEKRLEPVLGYSRNYTIKFFTPLKRSTGKYRITSSPAYTAYDADDVYRRFYFEETPLAFTGIYSINVLFGGNNLTYVPTIQILGDGVGAVATAVVTNGKITSINVNVAGSEYSTATVVAYDEDGNVLEDILLEAVIESNIGKIRTFYYDDNQIKKIYNDNAGTINYSTGVITLNEFMPVDIENDLKVLKFFAVPENTLFSADKNSILTIDPDDQAAIKINVVQVN